MKLSELSALAKIMPLSDHTPTEEDYLDFLIQQGLLRSEMAQKVEMDLRFVQFMSHTTKPDIRVRSVSQLHSHPFYEIIYCREPDDVEYLVGSNRYKLEAGDSILIPPGVGHMTIFPEEMTSGYVRDHLWINPDLIHIAPSPVPETMETLCRSPLFRTADTRWSQIGDVFAFGVHENQRRDTGWQNATVGAAIVIMSILYRIANDTQIDPPPVEKTSLVDQILEYMEEHLAEKITVSQVAAHFSVSESTLSQAFRKKMGISFYRCLTQRRLVAAKDMIRNDLPMEKVGQLAGFSDYSAFYRSFRQEFGISPRQYRKKCRPTLEDGLEESV